MINLSSNVPGAGYQPKFFFGEVISIQDPYRMMRAQVRIFGLTDDKRGIPDSDLPWYTTLMPSTSASLAGVGSSSGLEPGSKVLVLVMDYPTSQVGIIMGSMYPGPQSASHVHPYYKGLREKGPQLPRGIDGRSADIGDFGNVNITDKKNNAATKFKSILEKAQIFKNLNIFKSE